MTLTANNGAFGFDSDGIQDFTSVNSVVIPSGGITGYEGPNMTFDVSSVSGGNGKLVVGFNSPLAIGSSTYFSLEGNPSVGTGIVVGGSAPEPASLAMLGGGLLAIGGLVIRRRSRKG